MKLHIEAERGGYTVTIERGAIGRLADLLDLDRRVLVVTEPGVPARYAETVLAQCPRGRLHRTEGGEGGKSLAAIEAILADMAQWDMTRGDCVLAVGGGVIGDLAGFAASCYMRGVDFYNLPTTLLSQIDSSIGGKTAVNFRGIKNLVGAFHQPRAVVIDPALLATLPADQLANGMAEAVKMALCFDPDLIGLLESAPDPYAPELLETVISRSLAIKKQVVEQDERERGLRRVLNFGHTLGHGIEGLSRADDATGNHGHCVALGMLPMCQGEALRGRLRALLARLGLPTVYDGDIDGVIALALHDKKAVSDGIVCVVLDALGAFDFVKMDAAALRQRMKEAFDR